MSTCVLLLALLAAGLFHPAEGAIRKEGGYWVATEQGSLPAGSRLRISSVGSIAVRGEDSREVRYTVVMKVRASSPDEAANRFEAARFSAARRGATAVFSLQDPRCGRCNFSAEVSIVAPTSTQETILNTAGGSLDVRALEGRVNAETAGGTIAMNAIGGSVQAATAGGGISLESIGGAVRCETAGGNISLRRARGRATLATSGGSIAAEDIRGSLRAETAGGGIQISQVGGNVIAGTSGGSIRLDEVAGSVQAETAGGSIRVNSAPRGVRVETAGGSIELTDVAGAVWATNASGAIRASFLPGQRLEDSLLETNAGTIVVWLPAALRVTVEATIDLPGSAKRIQSDFTAIRILRKDTGFGPASLRARGLLNGGGPVLRIRNTSGRIQIRKRP